MNKKVSIKCPDNWKPGCICDSQASEPNEKCYIHGYPDARVCPYCGAFMNPTKFCKRCGYKKWERNKMNNHHYYYLHENGEIIGKSPIVVENDPEYFNSDFVKKVWKINLTNREDAWKLCLDATYLNANINRIKNLADKWHLTIEDLLEFMSRFHPTPEYKEKIIIFAQKIWNMNEETFWIKLNEEAIKKEVSK